MAVFSAQGLEEALAPGSVRWTTTTRYWRNPHSFSQSVELK
jgi:hypothetical protein